MDATGLQSNLRVDVGGHDDEPRAGAVRQFDRLHRDFDGLVAGLVHRMLRLVGPIIGVGAHQLVGVQVVGLKESFEPQDAAAAQQNPTEIGQRCLGRQVGCAGRNGDILQVDTVIVDGSADIRHTRPEGNGGRENAPAFQ